MNEQFTIDQEVAIYVGVNYRDHRYRFAKITKVGKKTVTTDDGKSWMKNNGELYGASKFACNKESLAMTWPERKLLSIEEAKKCNDEHKRKHDLEHKRSELERICWQSVPEETIDTIYDLTKRPKLQQQPE